MFFKKVQKKKIFFYSTNVWALFPAHVKIYYNKKALFFFFPITWKVLQVLPLLQHLGYIHSYHKVRDVSTKKEFLIVYLQYINQQPTTTTLKNYWKFGRYVTVRYKSFSKLNTKQAKFEGIVSTSHGLKTITECSRLRVGGILVYCIYG